MTNEGTKSSRARAIGSYSSHIKTVIKAACPFLSWTLKKNEHQEKKDERKKLICFLKGNS